MKLWKQKTDNPIRRMIDFVDAAERGDFSLTLPTTSEGEMGELERAINRLISELREGRDRWEEQKALQKELKLSRMIQSDLLPKSMPDIPGLEIHAFYRPAKQLGGDYYDFIDVDADHLGIVVADVAGKSVSAAMLMTIARNTLRSQALLFLSPAEVLERTQKLLLPNMASQFFVTFFYAVLDKKTLRLTCANAGHPPLLWYQAGEKKCEWVRPEGIAVGLNRRGDRPVCREERDFLLAEGDFVFLYTDGVTDANDPEGRYFGRDRLGFSALSWAQKGVEPHHGAEPHQEGGNFLSLLERELAAFSRDEPQSDDMTGVVIERTSAT